MSARPGWWLAEGPPHAGGMASSTNLDEGGVSEKMVTMCVNAIRQ